MVAPAKNLGHGPDILKRATAGTVGMECRLVGWPADEPRLSLDHEQFAYAGKFVMTRTGKAVAEADGTCLGATAFSRDRTDESAWWIRIVTVRRDRRGEGIGPRLLAFTAEQLRRRAALVRIAVNNPFAFEAAYKAGFGFTGEETGLAELVLEFPHDREPEGYRAGLERFRGRDGLSGDERAFLDDRDGTVPPLVVGRR